MDTPVEPRRRDAAKTRARILAAAYDTFSQHGYAKAGIREIAANANVASSLLIRYFGTKAALFEEALVHAIYAGSMFWRDKKKFGVKMARMIVEDDDARLTAMLVLAIADPESKEVAIKVTKRHIIEPLAEWLGPPEALSRAHNMFSVMTGFTIQMRHLTRDEISPHSIKWLAEALQVIVDEPQET